MKFATILVQVGIIIEKDVYITTNAFITRSILGEMSRRKIDKVISVYCIMTIVIYSVSCKDASTNYTYIDCTKNVSKIKYFHKHNSTEHPGVFYETIRNNGGWDNWNFTILETCDNNMDIQMKIKTYKSVLENTNVDINLHCDVCQYSCRKRSDYDKHCNSIKHKQRLSITRANDDITTLTSLVKEVLLSNQEIHKSSVEMHENIKGHTPTLKEGKDRLKSVIFQIIMIDIVFSFDSIITAIGLTKSIKQETGGDPMIIIYCAVIISMVIMLIFAKQVSDFINKRPTIKMIALAFLVTIGAVLIAEAFGEEVPKGYIYFAMFYALIVEFLNLKMRKNETKNLHKH